MSKIKLPIFKSSTPPFGLDISDYSLKLVSLQKTNKLTISKKHKSIFLNTFNQVSVPEGYFNQGEILQKEKIADLIKKLVASSGNNIKLSKYVISVLPETKAFIKLIEIPNTTEENIEEEVLKEIKNHFPFSPDEIYIDWQEIESNNPDKINIIVSIAPKKIIDDYTDLLLSAGLKPLALEIESQAICRALLTEEIRPPDIDSKSSYMIIDIGAARTSLIFYDQKTIQFTTSVPFSGKKITEKIAQKLKINSQEAEKAKIKCGLTDKKCQDILSKILFKDIEDMITKIKNSLLFYGNHFPDNNPIKKIILAGGGSNFQGLDVLLANKLALKVEKGNPLININKVRIQIPKNQLLSYTTTIGLALRGALIND
ncbi:type IV pilus assembly protein PilM [Candidatus Falkowbacteria bacterium]|nr:type IV pilus assembly protein PilM [Candidatus Falkowbacteria bacterium]